MHKTLITFRELIKINFKYFLQYRMSLFISLFLTSFWVLSFIVFVEVLFYQINTLAGLGKGQVLLILAFYYLFQTIGNIFYRDNFEDFADRMRQGEIDFILVKPVPSRLMTFCYQMRFDFLSSFFITAFLMVYAYTNMQQSFEILPFMLGCAYSIIGAIIFYSILSIIATLAFWLSKNETLGVLIWNLSQISRYPRNIFAKPIQNIFIFLLPFAVLANIPAEIAAKIADPISLVETLITGSILYILSLKFWEFGLKRYSSAN